MHNMIGMSLVGTLLGAAIGYILWQPIRLCVPRWVWMIATVSGWAIGFPMGIAASRLAASEWLSSLNPLGQGVLTAVLAGTVIGLSAGTDQYSVLRSRMSSVWSWIVPSMIGCVTGGAMLVLAVNAGYVLLLRMTMNDYALLAFGESNRAEGYIVPVWLSYIFGLSMSAASSRLVLVRSLRRLHLPEMGQHSTSRQGLTT